MANKLGKFSMSFHQISNWLKPFSNTVALPVNSEREKVHHILHRDDSSEHNIWCACCVFWLVIIAKAAHRPIFHPHGWKRLSEPHSSYLSDFPVFLQDFRFAVFLNESWNLIHQAVRHSVMGNDGGNADHDNASSFLVPLAASTDSFWKNRRCSHHAVHTLPVCHLISSFSFDKNTYRRIN